MTEQEHRIVAELMEALRLTIDLDATSARLGEAVNATYQMLAESEFSKPDRVPPTDGVPPTNGIETRYLPDATEDEVSRQSWFAYSFGKDRSLCPYATGTRQRQWWDDQWEVSERDNEG
jgi:hypothetical protein